MPYFITSTLPGIMSVLVMLLAGMGQAFAKQPILRLSTDLECPWICIGENDEKASGILPDLSVAVFDGSPWRPKTIKPQWTSSHKRLASGKIDALVAPLSGLSSNSPLGLSIAPSAIGLREQAIWAPKHTPFTWRGIKSLVGKRLAVAPDRDNGLTLLFYFEGPAASEDIHLVKGENSAARMLSLLHGGKTDLIIHESTQLSWHARQMNMDGLFQEATRLDTEFLYIAFTNRNSDARAMADWYETRIKALRKNGRLQDILAKYGQKDWLVN